MDIRIYDMIKNYLDYINENSLSMILIKSEFINLRTPTGTFKNIFLPCEFKKDKFIEAQIPDNILVPNNEYNIQNILSDFLNDHVYLYDVVHSGNYDVNVGIYSWYPNHPKFKTKKQNHNCDVISIMNFDHLIETCEPQISERNLFYHEILKISHNNFVLSTKGISGDFPYHILNFNPKITHFSKNNTGFHRYGYISYLPDCKIYDKSINDLDTFLKGIVAPDKTTKRKITNFLKT